MEELLQKLQDYLQTALGISIQPVQWSGTHSLPVFLGDMYTFYEVRLLEVHCLLMAEYTEEEHTTAAIRKHIVLVRETFNGEVIYLRKTMLAFTRKRLVEKHIPFIVPGNQMYLPFLGTDLREHFITHVKEKKRLSPAAQAVMVYILLHEIEQVYTLLNLGKDLKYSAMTMTRAVKELAAVDLCLVQTHGREKRICFGDDKRALWEKARAFMRTPVKKRVWIQRTINEPHGIKAGLTALAEYSLLAEPRQPVYAIGSDTWKSIQNSNTVIELPVAEPEAMELEIWRYDPLLFVENNIVDQFSLYLSLRESQDERVETALMKMMEKIEW